MSTETLIRVPDRWRSVYASKAAAIGIKAGVTDAGELAFVAEDIISKLEAALNAKADTLESGEEFVIRWDTAVDWDRVHVTPAKSSPAAALLALVKNMKAGKPVAAKASSSGLDSTQLTEIVKVVAAAAAQGAAQGAQARQMGTMEIESQDIPVPGQLGRMKKRITTRRIPNGNLPDLRG